jgi:fibronectin type 3 domain-containing protein
VVNLNWNAPANSPDPVAGYNVYRAPGASTTYQQLNASSLSQTAYVDDNVQDGQTYNYIVESVDAIGDTSVPSNTASVTIP